MVRRILVIKLGALGDFVLATGCFAAIRAHHPDAAITLLTGAPFAELAGAAPYFDRVAVDARPAALDLAGWWRLRRWLRAGRFDRVYDLQTSDRTDFYFRLMGPGARPEWSGIARGCSHPHANPNRDRLHILDSRAEQLAAAGIENVPPPDLAWAARPMPDTALPEKFVLLVPGGAAHRPKKRWPVAHYAALAQRARDRGVVPVIVGGTGEADLAKAILAAAPGALDLTGKTAIGHLVWLARRAAHAVGNDTGPMHVLIAGGAPGTVLYSADSDPALSAPRGPRVTILHRPDLADLTVAEVAATLPLG